MYKKFFQITFIVSFIILLIAPTMTINLHKNTLSTPENRRLANRPRIFLKDDNKAPDALFNPKGDQEIFNKNFFREFETWLNDNIGFRTFMVSLNAKIQYHLFKVFIINSNIFLGPNNELNEMGQGMIEDYQHLNLYDTNHLKKYTDGLQTISNYAKSKNASFYYFQNWDKHSIYPESIPVSLKQADNLSKTDTVLKALKQHTDINIISPKQELISEKKKHRTYFSLFDSLHWNDRGSKIGYQKLIREINKKENKNFKILTDKDYDISVSTNEFTIFDTIHQKETVEYFKIKNKSSEIVSTEFLNTDVGDKEIIIRRNENADNKTRILLICDCYFYLTILDDIAESFYETYFFQTDDIRYAKEIIDRVNPNIVVLESAERMDRSDGIIDLANKIKNT